MRHPFVFVLAALLLAACGGTSAVPDEDPVPILSSPVGRIVEGTPQVIDPDGRYLMYLHNSFAETAGPDDTHPEFGAYELQAILEAFAERRFTVIAGQREPRADVVRWSLQTAGQVRELLAAGVPPERITVVGFSKGGAIAILTSSELATDGVNFVFLAACGDWIRQAKDLEPRGRLLAIREASDDIVGSCSELFTMAPDGTQTYEIELHLGGGHGAFFTPRSEWVSPTIAWAHGDEPENR